MSLISAAQAYARRPHLPNFVRLALNTGCRKNEPLGLEWERVDFERACFRLEPEHTKGGKRRLVPLKEMAMSALADQREWVGRNFSGSHWVFPSSWVIGRTRTIQKGFAAACERAGMENFRIHDLRHKFASWLVMDGVSLYVVKDLLGHSSISVTERYAQLSPDQGWLAVQQLLVF
ncbi:site-specific integrase [Trinickia sp. NRRL B-1857]|uniref:site-specific integrase n=1 Tax=Trinickia sp. NRRL B-1857 TaxID=3162879 RepID=UPI003D28515C